MKVCAVIPTGEQPVLPLLTLTSLLNQTHTLHSVLILINRFGDVLGEELLSLIQCFMAENIIVRIRMVPQIGMSEQRKVGYVQAQRLGADAVLFADDDTVYPKGFVEQAVFGLSSAVEWTAIFGVSAPMIDVTERYTRFDQAPNFKKYYERMFERTPAVDISQLEELLSFSFGGTLMINTKGDAESLFGWTKDYPDLGEDKLLCFRILTMGLHVGFRRNIAYHLRQRVKEYAGSSAVIHQALSSGAFHGAV